MIKKYTAPLIVALCVCIILFIGIWHSKKLANPADANEEFRLALQSAVLTESPLSDYTRHQLASALKAQDLTVPLRKAALLYALKLHDPESHQKKRKQGLNSSNVAPDQNRGTMTDAAEALLNMSPIGEDISLELSENEQLGVDPGLLKSVAVLPMSSARIQRYVTAPKLPTRNELFVSRVMQEQRFAPNNLDDEAKILSKIDMDTPALAHELPTPPYPVNGQVAALSQAILDTHPHPLGTRLRKIDGLQAIAISGDDKISDFVLKHCVTPSPLKSAALPSGIRNLVSNKLIHIGLSSRNFRPTGCAGQSLIIAGEETDTIANNWLLILSPSKTILHSGVLFMGISPTFAIEEIGTTANQAIYITRQNDGSGGMLNSLVIDLMRSQVLASVELLPDGEINYLLKSSHGPQYLILRQSAITSRRSISNGAPKRTLTCILRLSKKTASYQILNFRLSRRSRDMNRIGFLNAAQIPGIAAKFVCGLSEKRNIDCEAGPQALLAEAHAHQEADDPQGAARFYEAFIKKVEIRAYISTKEEQQQLLSAILQDAISLFSSQQYNRLSTLCGRVNKTKWIIALGKTPFNNAISTCQNLLGMSERNLGNYAASREHFENAQIADQDDPAPFGNLIRHRIDVNQPHQALNILLNHLFDSDAANKYTEYQRLQFAQAAAMVNHSSLAALFLLPNHQVRLPMFGMTLSIAGEVSYETGNYELGLQLLDESLHYLDSFALQDLGTDILLSYARILASSGRPIDAQFVLSSLTDVDVEIPLPVRAKAYDLMAEISEKSGDFSSAFAWSNNAVKALQNSFPDQRDHERYFSSLLGLNRTIIERWFSLAKINGITSEKLYQWSLFWKSAPAFQDAASTPLPQLDADECSVDFIKMREELWRFARCGSNPTILQKVHRGNGQIVKLISQIRQQATTAQFNKKAGELADELLEDIHLNKVRRLYITTDSGLSEIPWTALPSPKSSGYIIDTTQIIQYYPGKTLKASQGATSLSNIGAIASAGQTHDSRGMTLPPLASVPLEISSIRKEWPAASFSKFSDFNVQGATSGSWQSVLANSQLLHVAAHGEPNLAQPDLSEIILSSGSHEERITPRSLNSFNLSQADLAVLNVCSGGYMRAEDTFSDIGFRTILLQRGVGGVIDAKWEIGDERGAQFSRVFYAKLRRGAQISDAFFSTIQSLKKDDPNPNVWGAYSFSVRDTHVASKYFTQH